MADHVHTDHSDRILNATELTQRLGPLMTGGNDFHGAHKPHVRLGQGWPPYAFLKRLQEKLQERHGAVV